MAGPFPGALEQWLAARLPAAHQIEVIRVSRLPGGASNETVALDLAFVCDGYRYVLPLVLRPERSGGILAPYDVARQFRVMRALATTAVPVPPVAWYEPDPGILGAPFFLMSRVEGETLPLFWYGHSPRLQSAARMLATIHSVDWRAAELDFLVGGQEGQSPVSSELAAWRARADHYRVARAPLLIALGHFLVANEPPDARLSLLHGDPNPGNYLFDLHGDTVVAVLDWELAAIGDPRSDLGFYAALLTIFGGFPSESGHTLLSHAYEAETGTPLRDLDYYEALGLYRMAIVMAGWVARPGVYYGMDAIARRLSSLLGPRWAA